MKAPLTFAPGHHKSCGCPDCLVVRRRYGKLHAVDVHRNGPRWALADAAAERLHALTAQGWSTVHIAHVTDVEHASCLRVLNGTQLRIHRDSAARILAARMHPSTAPTPGTPVPAVGMHRRVHALYRMGWTSAAITEAGGVSDMQLRRVLAHHSETCSARTWLVVDRAYRALAMQPGPSATTRRRATAAGYAPPLAWDDDTIDDPTARPDLGARERGQDIGDIEWLISTGATWTVVASRCGVTKDAIDIALRRAKRLDLIARLTNAQVAS